MATVANKAYAGAGFPVDPHIPSPIQALGAAKLTHTVVPSDTINFPFIASEIQVGTGGTVTVVKLDDTTQQFTAASGDRIPVRCKRINSSGTAALLMVALG